MSEQRDKLLEIFRAGGVVTIDGYGWRVESAHAEEDMPKELAAPMAGEDSDDWIGRQSAWFDSLFIDGGDTGAEVVEALCRLAGVRVRRA